MGQNRSQSVMHRNFEHTKNRNLLKLLLETERWLLQNWGEKVLISIRECKTPKFSQGDYEASFAGEKMHILTTKNRKELEIYLWQK